MAKRWALRRVQEDCRKGPAELECFFLQLELRLFDKKLKLKDLTKTCGFGSRARVRLTEFLGIEPWRYIESLRMDVARRLLGEPEAKVWKIASEVGYGSLASFSNAFQRVHGVRPDVYRKAQAGVPRVAAPASDFPPQLIQRGIRGLLEPDEARDLLQTLRSLYSQRETPTSFDDRKLFAEAEAAHVWQAIREAPFERSRATVRLHGSRTLFDLLLKKGRQEGRSDALRGVELALLAVESLESCAAELGEAVHDLRALGWAWVANARRFLPGRAGAEEAFRQAEAAWCVPRASPDPNVEALLWDYKAALRSYERRFAEALELENRAVERYQVLGAITPEAAALIERGRIHLYAGNPQGTIVDNHRAIALLGECESYLRLSGYQTLAIAYVRIEDFSSAADALRQAKRLCSGYPEAWLKIRWVEGLIHQGRADIARAETCLVEAHQGLLELGQIEDAAVVALDRAILCAEQGRSAEVVPLATEVAAVFEASRVERERLAALRVLGAEVAKGAVSLEMLRNARDELRSVPAV